MSITVAATLKLVSQVTLLQIPHLIDRRRHILSVRMELALLGHCPIARSVFGGYTLTVRQ